MKLCRRGLVVRRASSCELFGLFCQTGQTCPTGQTKSRLPGKRAAAAGFAATAACPSGPSGPQGPSCQVFRDHTCASAFDRAPQLLPAELLLYQKFDFFSKYYCTLQKNMLQYKRRMNLFIKHIGGIS